MQIVSNGDNLHEMLNPVFWENMKNVSTLLSAELGLWWYLELNNCLLCLDNADGH